MPHLAGIDGCKGGWVATLRDLETDRVSVRVVEHIEELFRGPEAPVTAAIDIPIGLVHAGSRTCDVEARRLLKGRASTVFPAPIRAALGAATYSEANALTKALAGFGLSAQAFAISPKIAEVDRFARARGPGLLREAHPELVFVLIHGGLPLARSKHDWAGLMARRSRALRARSKPIAASLPTTSTMP